MKMARSLVSLALAAALSAPLLAAEPALVLVCQAPAAKIDGRLNDPCWARASTVHPFVLSPQRYPAIEPSWLLLSHDERQLYVALICECHDAEKLRFADGDPTLNDRIELTVRWRRAPDASVIVDAAGRVRHAPGLRGVEAAARRTQRGYAIEIAIPRPPAVSDVAFAARRYNEITGEVSTCGLEESMAYAKLTRHPAPAVKIERLSRRAATRGTVRIVAVNPRDGYVPLRCRAVPRTTTGSLPHLLRLQANQSVVADLAFSGADARATGLQLVFDDPQGGEVFMRSVDFRMPPGGPARRQVISVIPYPQVVMIKVKRVEQEEPKEADKGAAEQKKEGEEAKEPVLVPEEEPFALDSRCRIIVGRRRNKTERHAARLLQREIKELFGLDLPIHKSSYSLASPAIILGTRRTTLLARRLEAKFGLAINQAYPDQAYVLGIRSDLIGIAAYHETGTLYGAQTLIQLLPSAQHQDGKILLPAMSIRDWPTMPLRGWLRRGARIDPPAMYPALMRYKVNLLTEVPGRDPWSARMNQIHLATLALPTAQPVAARRQQAYLTLPTPEAMLRPLRRSLSLPVALEEGTVKPPKPATEESETELTQQLIAQTRRPTRSTLRQLPRGPAGQTRWIRRTRAPKWAEEFDQRTLQETAETQAVAAAWIRGDPWALHDAAQAARLRTDMVGLCGGPRGSDLLPPSWAAVVAASEYGWSPHRPSPEDFLGAFYPSFYGSAEVREARDLLERAAASLPRNTSLAPLLDPERPAPSPPRPDLAKLVKQARAKAATATRNKELAALLAQSGSRVLAAATNVLTGLRVRELYAEAQRLERAGLRAGVAKRLAAMANCLRDGRSRRAALLGDEAALSPDTRLYAHAAATARKLAEQCERGGELPGPARFWQMLRGEQP